MRIVRNSRAFDQISSSQFFDAQALEYERIAGCKCSKTHVFCLSIILYNYLTLLSLTLDTWTETWIYPSGSSDSHNGSKAKTLSISTSPSLSKSTFKCPVGWMAMGADLMQLDFLGFGDEAKLLGSSQKDPAVAGLIRQIQELQRELAREKSLWQEDHHQQSKFLLRQEQRRWQEWQEGLGGDEPSTSCTLLEDLQQCRDLQRTVSQMKNQLRSHGLSHQQAKATQVKVSMRDEVDPSGVPQDEGKEAKEVDQGICIPLTGPQPKEGDPGHVDGSESSQKEPCPSRESESVGETEVGEDTAARSQDDAAKKSTTESKEEAAEVVEEVKGASPRMEDTVVARQQVQESPKASTEVLEPKEDKEDKQAASEAQDVAKAKGKGKGCKGKGGKGPPLPTSKAMAKSAVKIREIKKSLVTLHWKALPALNETNAPVAKDPLLQNCRDLLSLAKGSEVTPGASDSVGIIDFAESAQASQAGVFDDVDVCADLPEAMDEAPFALSFHGIPWPFYCLSISFLLLYTQFSLEQVEAIEMK